MNTGHTKLANQKTNKLMAKFKRLFKTNGTNEDIKHKTQMETKGQTESISHTKPFKMKEISQSHPYISKTSNVKENFFASLLVMAVKKDKSVKVALE